MLPRVIDVFKMILVQQLYRNYRFGSIPFFVFGDKIILIMFGNFQEAYR